MRDRPQTRIGVLGGSFDPPHVAHLIMAETVREALALDRILFLPAGTQPLKQGKRATPAEQRVAMVELAILGNPAFSLSRIDVDRPGPSYTADSLQELREEWGGAAAASLWFIIGTDSLLSLPRWRAPARIISLSRLAIVRRPTFDIGSLDALEAAIPGLARAIDWIDAPLMEISSTDIRARLAEGRSVRYRVPDAVREYIEREGLYREG